VTAAALNRPRDCSFAPGDWDVLARFWYPVAFAADIGAAPVAVRLLDERLVVYRAGARAVVARDLCIHRGVPLSIGYVQGDEIVCRYHGLRFGPDGLCRAIPSEPGAVPTERMRIQVFPVVERYGLVWTSLDPQADPARIPVFPEWDDPEFIQILPPSIDIAGAAGRQCEGFLDVAHFAFVHQNTFADPNNPVVPSYAVSRREDGVLVSDYISDVANIPHGMAEPVPVPEGFLWRRLFEVQFPFFPRLTIFFPEGLRLCLFNCATPVSARTTRLFVPIARNFDRGGDLASVYDFNRRVFEEDRAIVETQYPEDLPLDLMAEAHIRADRASIAYRRGLKELGLGRAYTA
jgi:vanillate O-demethylase monooxygenase subunit